MSEYKNVEKPFLEQLSNLGWTIIDQGPAFPTDPSKSLRTDFKEIIIRSIFYKNIRSINRTENNHVWLTDKQLDELYDQIMYHPSKGLLEINESVQARLYRTQVDYNDITQEEYPDVHLIDFKNPDNNHFLAVNQFRIDTPGRVKECIIPDIVLFINGLPLVVIECKDANPVQANPMYEAFIQLRRYTDQREETKKSGLKEGEPKLFYTNQFMIRTCGDKANFGTITASEETWYSPWKDITPETYKQYTLPLGKERQQEILIQGMLPKETLLDIIRNCTIFMDIGKTRAKIVCRYQQYRATCKIIERLQKGKTPAERSGVIWATQGSGKSLTMVFVIRKLRTLDDIKNYKVCLVNDRKDLEDQLGKTASLTGEKVFYITSTNQLRDKLASDVSNLNMVMIHKFQENQGKEIPDYVKSALEYIPTFETFGIVNSSERILLMLDEAHRTQSGDFGDNLFEAFPNATRLAFTGTPLIRVKDKKKTVDRFGEYIDKYKLQDAVDDGATIQILYEGKTSDAAIYEKSEFDNKVNKMAEEIVEYQLKTHENIETLKRMAKKEKRTFEDLMTERTEFEIIALKKKWGTNGDILEADERIEAISQDIVDHYITNILPNGFKAQVVCSSKLAAIKYKKYIDKAIGERLNLERSKDKWEGDPAQLPEAENHKYQDISLCNQLSFLKSAVVISSDGTNEKAEITKARKYAKEVKAVDNFKKAFNDVDPDKTHTGIAFLIVCDMLLTGFDAPIEQVMYIDKKIKDHNLLQTIARVNRVAKNKSRGYIVDYIGLANHLKEALSIYGTDDQQDIQASLKDITEELPVLESRYQRLLNLFRENGVNDIQDFVEQTNADANKSHQILEASIEIMEDIKLRATFEVYFKNFMQSLDIILPKSSAIPYKIPVKRFGYILIKVKERYKDETLTISGSGEKVKKLINDHLISLGINPKIPPVELLSDRFIAEVEKNTSHKAKASEMEHAIRKHCKIHLNKDPAFYSKLSEKLERLIQEYKDNWEELYNQLFRLRDEAETGRKDKIEGISPTAAPFYDLIGQIAFGKDGIPEAYENQIKDLVISTMEYLHDTIGIINFWQNIPEVSKLKGALSDLMLLSGIHPIEDAAEKLVTEMTSLAKARHQEIMA
jgi:type I restriction enzyme R subunit